MTTLEPRAEIADGVYRCGSGRVNWYLLEGDGGLAVVGAGFPTHWEQLTDRLAAAGYEPSDVDARVPTHAHPDHIGFARRLHEEADVPVRVHEAGVRRARDGGDPPLGGIAKNPWRPAILRYLVEVVRSDGIETPSVTTAETFVDGSELDVPGHPRMIHVPGHTEGEVAFHLADRDVLHCGDALATADFET